MTPGKRLSRSSYRSVVQRLFPSSRWRMTPASRSTRNWWVSVDGATETGNVPGEPGFLQHVLGVRHSAQHAVDNGEQQLAIGDARLRCRR
jgi:hypothetical protein